MNRTILKLAASALIVGTMGAATATEVTPKMMRASAKAADQAIAALKQRQQADAVRFAERAVLYNPSDADNRALLGQAYLQAGRFSSAENAFSDALRLAPEHGRAALGLGLVQVALGKSDQALATLASARGRVPDADLGLALSLAGDHAGGIALLEPAARAADATAKTRQNLALAYALAGRWSDAHVTAAQDIPANQLAQRMTEWAQFVRPSGTNEQLAKILNVKPVIDHGIPAELALLETKPAASAATEQAAAEPQPAAAANPVELAQAPTPAVEAPAPQPQIQRVEVPQSAALLAAPSAEPAKPALLSVAAAGTASKPYYVKPMATKPTAAPRPASAGSFVVQLGAFSSQSRLAKGWNASVSKASWLKGYTPVSTTFKNPDDGRALYRLAISGFASRIEAVNLCRKVRERGGICFVRGRAGDAPMQWVKRDVPAKEAYASR